MALEDTPHLNIYVPWAVFRNGLRRGERGGLKDILCTLALLADLDADTGKIGQLPIPAPYVIESSAGNSQPVYPLLRALQPADAHALARALADYIGCDHGTADIAHIWRVAGTLNWPNKKKLERGRSPVPQQVKVTTGWTGKMVDPDALKAAMGVRPGNTRNNPTGSHKVTANPDRDVILARIAGHALFGRETVHWINRRYLAKDKGRVPRDRPDVQSQTYGCRDHATCNRCGIR